MPEDNTTQSQTATPDNAQPIANGAGEQRIIQPSQAFVQEMQTHQAQQPTAQPVVNSDPYNPTQSQQDWQPYTELPTKELPSDDTSDTFGSKVMGAVLIALFCACLIITVNTAWTVYQYCNRPAGDTGESVQTAAGYGTTYTTKGGGFYCANYYIDKHGVTPIQVVGLAGMAVVGIVGMYQSAVRRSAKS